MKRIFSIIILLGVVMVSAFGNGIPFIGTPYHPIAPLTWSATNVLPPRVTVYKVVPKPFSNEVISNVVALAGISLRDLKPSSDKKTLHWRNKGIPLTRGLTISPLTGWLEYGNSAAIAPHSISNYPVGVPTYEEVERLALKYLILLGGDTNQLSFKPQSRTDERRSRWSKSGELLMDEEVTMRGIMLARQLDGIRFNGPCGRGGISLDFGDNAQLYQLMLNWRNVEPYRQYQTATPEQILAWIKEGKAFDAGLDFSDEESAPVGGVKEITITQITPYYWGEPGGSPQEFCIPFAELKAVAHWGDTNTTVFTLHCPIIDESKPLEKDPE